MMKKQLPLSTVSFALGCSLLGLGGCAVPWATVPQPSPPAVDATPKPVATTSPTPAPLDSPPQAEQEETYKQGLAKAESAENISRSALTVDDWRLVVVRWQQAVQLLKSLPKSSPYASLAREKVPQFEQKLAVANKKVAQAQGQSDRDLGSVASAVPFTVGSADGQRAESGQIFRAPIKRRAGGTPIIDVLFNGNQTFEMIVDTGASSTVITGAMAEALGVQFVGKTKVNTASQAGVEIPLAYVRSIAVGQARIEDVIVAVGNEALPIGLLGHDFFSDYDVTVKRDVVEFRQR